MSGSIGVAFLPWIVFVVAARNGGIGLAWSAVAGAVVAAGVIAVSRRRGSGVRGFEVGAAVCFAGLGLAALLAGSHRAGLDDYARAVAAGYLALLALGSLVRRPLTVAYTRDAVRRSELASPGFLAVNRRITAVWAAGASATALSFAVGAKLDGAVAATFFNWYLPIVLVLGCTRCCVVQWRHSRNDDEEEEQVLLASLAGLPTAVRSPHVAERPDPPRLRPLPGGKAR